MLQKENKMEILEVNIPELFTTYSSNSLPLCSMHNITFVYVSSRMYPSSVLIETRYLLCRHVL